MYKLLIVDDEPIERETLAMIVSRCFDDIEVVGEASNGREAIMKARELNPDMIFMDIKMPGINGIEAAQTIKSGNRTTKIVLVTAYDYFEYAKDSLKIGIDDFLLKPVLKEDVIESIGRMTDKINLEKKQKQFDENVTQKLKELGSFIQNELISSILLRLDEEQVQEYFHLLDIKFTQGYGVMVHIGESEPSLPMEEGIRKKVYGKRIYEKILQKLTEMRIRYISSIMNDFLYLIILIEKPNSEYNQKMYSLHLVNCLEEYVKNETGVNLSIGIGMAYDSAVKLFDSFLEAQIALTYEANPEQAIHFSDIDVKIDYKEYPYHIEKSLCEKIIKCDKAECAVLMEKLLKWVIANCESIMHVRQKLFEIIVMLTRSAAIFEHIENGLLDTSRYYEEVKSIQSVNEISTYMNRIINELTEGIDKVRKINSNRQIAKAVEFINKNYMKEITLEEVAKAVSLSPYYFSRLFKQETSENFVDYLTKYRMATAKKLLTDKSCSIKDVSYNVGYNDPNYFSKLFKKHYGVNPSEFKER